MGLFGKRKNIEDSFSVGGGSTGATGREALERRRLQITAELESLTRSYSRESGNRKLGKRRFPVGMSPNDYGYRK